MPDPKKRRTLPDISDELVELPAGTQRRFQLAWWQRWRDFVGYFWPRDGEFALVSRLVELGAESVSRAERKQLVRQHSKWQQQSAQGVYVGVFSVDLSWPVRLQMEDVIKESVAGSAAGISSSCLRAVDTWVFQLAWLPYRGYLPASIPKPSSWDAVFELRDIESEWVDKTISQITAGAGSIDCFDPLPAYFSLEPLAGPLGLSWPLRAPVT